MELVHQGLCPDLIMFSDPGSERPETYSYLAYFDAWLRAQGFPGITRVAYRPARARYLTIEGNLLANETLPSIAFWKRRCSMKVRRLT